MDERRDETEWEREDRNLGELLQELRIALPGVQVLFAFLLAVPFQRRFGEVTEFQKTVYFMTLMFTAVSTMLLIGPTAFHRMTFRRQQKDRLLILANRMSLAGLAFLALAVTGAVMLVADFLYGTALTVLAASVTLALAALFWLLIPLSARRRADRR